MYIVSVIIGWIIYVALCKSPLAKKGIWFALIGFLIATGFAYFYCKVFSSRGAYIHLGALLGTIMVGNVFFVIIPGQRKLVEALTARQTPDPQYGIKAKQRRADLVVHVLDGLQHAFAEEALLVAVA